MCWRRWLRIALERWRRNWLYSRYGFLWDWGFCSVGTSRATPGLYPRSGYKFIKKNRNLHGATYFRQAT